MSYIVKQYNFNKNNSSNIEEDLIKLDTTACKATRIVLSTGNTDIAEECVKISTDNNFNSQNTYYLHAKIKRMDSDFTLKIQLYNYNDRSIQSQFLKTVDILKKNGEELYELWYDFEIIFKPSSNNFNCVVFQMERTSTDIISNYRIPFIVYEELSLVKNFKNTLTTNIDSRIVKFGIQANPGTLMCINGQEIHVGKSGIYEIRNGIIYLDYFSIIKSAIEDDSGDNHNYNRYVDTYFQGIATFEELLEKFSDFSENSPPISSDPNVTYSQCIFGHKKIRNLDSFTIDYMYEDS